MRVESFADRYFRKASGHVDFGARHALAVLWGAVVGCGVSWLLSLLVGVLALPAVPAPTGAFLTAVGVSVALLVSPRRWPREDGSSLPAFLGCVAGVLLTLAAAILLA